MAAAPERLTEISTRHAVYLQRLGSGEVAQTQKFLLEMQEVVRRELAGQDITDFTRTRLESLISSIDRDLVSITNRLKTQVVDESIALATYEAGFEVRRDRKSVV
jgi:hypothetical protein